MNRLLDVEFNTVLIPVCWTGIRSEYFRVWADFPRTTAPFGIHLTSEQLNAIGHLLVSMDLIDTLIDCQPAQSARQQLGEGILHWMRNGLCSNWLDEESITDRLVPLRTIIQHRNIIEPFLSAAERVLHASEGKRNSRDVRSFIKNLIDEGQAAAEMTICLMGSNTNRRLNNFLMRIMRIGTLVDTLLDASDDYQHGRLKLTPNRLFRLKLKAAIARQLPGLVRSFPDRRLLWNYCMSYTKPSTERPRQRNINPVSG